MNVYLTPLRVILHGASDSGEKKLKTGITTGKNRFYHKNGDFSEIEIVRSRIKQYASSRIQTVCNNFDGRQGKLRC